MARAKYMKTITDQETDAVADTESSHAHGLTTWWGGKLTPSGISIVVTGPGTVQLVSMDEDEIVVKSAQTSVPFQFTVHA